MLPPPAVCTLEEHLARRRDAAFWAPYVAEILGRHDLVAGTQPVAGWNATNPTFVCGDVVVKLFGITGFWRASHAAERAAHALLSTDPEIRAPRVLAEGRLYDDADEPWPYLVTARVPGVSWRDADLTEAQRHAVAADLGEQVRRVHALVPDGAAEPSTWPQVDVTEAAHRSSLPPHLCEQVTEFVARLGPDDPVFLHGDLVDMHVFVDGGRLSGIIDWGDALVTDRHYELMQVHRGLFDCDRALLRLFLDAYGWPMGEDFAFRALAHGIRRQALGLAQHHGMDVFEPVAARYPLDDIATLEELAMALFGV